MQLTILLHSQGSDSASGYETFESSEILHNASISSEKELTGLLKRNGFVVPYVFLCGGHAIGSYVNQDPSIRSKTILAVPKDPVVRLLLPDREWVSSVEFTETKVADFINRIRELGIVEDGDHLLMDSTGNVLEDKTVIKFSSFDISKPLLVKQQMEEHENLVAEVEDSDAERVTQSYQLVCKTQRNWCYVGDMKANISTLARTYLDGLKTVFATPSAHFQEKRPSLISFEYAPFVEDFPSEQVPDRQDSEDLTSVKEELQVIQQYNSGAPQAALDMIDALETYLVSTNSSLADQAAAQLRPLLDPMNLLAGKDPMEHDHQALCDRLTEAQKAINSYCNIKAGNMHGNPQEFLKHQQTLAVLLEKMGDLPTLSRELQSEWDQAEAWADLAGLEGLETGLLEAAEGNAAELARQAREAAELEREGLEGLQAVGRDADFFYGFLRRQVGWCMEAAQTAAAAAAADLEEIDAQLESLLARRAERDVARQAHEQRVRDLQAHAAAEAERYEQFKREYGEREVKVQERVWQAAVGQRAAEDWQEAMAGLIQRLRSELSAVRDAAMEMRVDVGADLAEAYRLGCNANFIQAYYEEEKIKGLKENKEARDKAYRIAMRQEQHDEAQVLRNKIEEIDTKLTASSKRVLDLNARSAELERDVAPAWALLCSQAVGGPVATRAGRVCVRGSKASQEAWGGDRSLERPDEKNSEMRVEADRALLLVGN